MRNDKKEPLERAKERFTENKCFRMSAVHFQSNAAQEYIHTPIKIVVDLGNTKLDPLLSRAEGQIIQAQPALTLSEINELQQSQRFDVIALVEQVSDSVPTQLPGRVRRQIQIIDQSAPDSKVQETKFAFFCDAEPSQKDRATINILQQASGTTEPLSFFGLSGKKVDQGFAIENSKDFFVMKAIGARASKLTGIAEQLHATPTQERVVLETAIGSGRNYKDELGMESFCKMLHSMTNKTNISSIDEGPTLWQLNWVEVVWPECSESDLCTKDGRIFFLTDIRDISGMGPRVRVNQESALDLARVSTKEEFLAQHAAGKQTFPVMATVKIVRETVKQKDAGGDGPHSAQELREYINFTVVHALDQPLHERPTQATLTLLPLMPHVEHDSACMLPSALRMVKPCAHYAFQVGAPTGCMIPCQKIISLVKSTKNSSTQSLNNGFKVVTSDIEDMLGDDLKDSPSTPTPKFVLSSTCTLDNLTAYKLDAPRGGTQHALVTITNKIDDVFVVDQVQLLSPEQAAQAKASLSQLLHLAIEMNQKDFKRNAPWDDTMSPVQAKRCRVLGRSPTAPPIEENIA